MNSAWVITDTHFGFKNFNKEWLDDIQMKFIYEQFIPQVKKSKGEDDILIHCGDVFDHRQINNIYTLNRVIELFEVFSDTFKEVYVIAGNHDIYNKSTNDINSLKVIKYIPRINVFDIDPVFIKSKGGKKITFMPWNETVEEECEDLENIGHSDFLFCHTTVKNSYFNKYTKIEHGMEQESFKSFGTVYSGHIHLSSKTKNIVYLGSPYEMDRNDIDNPKGFYRINFDEGTEEFYENELSPKHIKLTISDLEKEDISEKVKNNFVDLAIPSDLKNSKDIVKFAEKLNESKKIKMVFVDPDYLKKLEDLKDKKMEVSNIMNMDISNLIDSYIMKLDYNENLKEKSSTFLKKLLKEVSK